MKEMTVTEKAFGKINLYLDVLGKRDDGYHNIISVMHSVGVYDTVTVTEADGVSMTCTDKGLTCGEDNLCIKAARAFFARTGVNGGCLIHLEKHLPSGAGMAGGSSDAAAVLRGLNRIYGGRLTVAELCEIGKTVGADVPFCVVGGTVRTEGIGEIMTPLAPLPPCSIVICEGGAKVSTPEAYRLIDNTPPSKSGNYGAFERALVSGDLKGICDSMYNRFEDTYPLCGETKSLLADRGAVGTLMTGSGSAVFGIFEDFATAKAAASELNSLGITSVAVENR